MNIKIAIIGDYDASKVSHPLTDAAIEHAARYLPIKSTVTWLPTLSFLKKEGAENIKSCDAVWASPGSPYNSMEGAIMAIRIAREMKKPFIGT